MLLSSLLLVVIVVVVVVVVVVYLFFWGVGCDSVSLYHQFPDPVARCLLRRWTGDPPETLNGLTSNPLSLRGGRRMPREDPKEGFTTRLYCTVLYYTVLYYKILYYTILYYTILYYYYTRLYYPRFQGVLQFVARGKGVQQGPGITTVTKLLFKLR